MLSLSPYPGVAPFPNLFVAFFPNLGVACFSNHGIGVMYIDKKFGMYVRFW